MIKVNPSVMNKFIFLIDRFMNIKKYIEMKYMTIYIDSFMLEKMYSLHMH